MPVKDLPDYTRQMIIRHTGGFVGLSELAARQWSIVPWDIDGNVFMMEDFSCDLANWTTSTDGAGASVAIDGTHYMGREPSLKLLCPSGAGTYARAYRLLPHLGNKKYAFACGLALPTNIPDIRFLATFKKGDTYTYSAVKISRLDQEISIKTGAGSWQVIISLDQVDDTVDLFHLLLFSVDLGNSIYKKLLFDDTEYDISAYSLSSVDNVDLTDYIKLELQNNAVNGAGGTIWAGNIIAARNIP